MLLANDQLHASFEHFLSSHDGMSIVANALNEGLQPQALQTEVALCHAATDHSEPAWHVLQGLARHRSFYDFIDSHTGSEMIDAILGLGVPSCVFLSEHSLRVAAGDQGIPKTEAVEMLAEILCALEDFRLNLAEPEYWKALAYPIPVESIEQDLIEKPIQKESNRVAMELHNALVLLSKYTLLWDEVVCRLLGSELKCQVEPGMSCAEVQRLLRQDRTKYPIVVALLTRIAATAWQLELMKIGQQPAAAFAKLLPAVPWDLIPDVNLEPLFRQVVDHADAASLAAWWVVDNMKQEARKVARRVLDHAGPVSERLFGNTRLPSPFAMFRAKRF